MELELRSMTPTQLVNSFAKSKSRFHSYQKLVSMGTDAIPAIREGLKNENWQIRRWSAICLDQVASTDALNDLIPLFRDPSSKVRLWAIHSVACDHCKDDVHCSVDIVPELIERIRKDESMRVRRMAVIMLATEFTDTRAIDVFRQILDTEEDRKLRLHAANGLKRLHESGAGKNKLTIN